MVRVIGNFNGWFIVKFPPLLFAIFQLVSYPDLLGLYDEVSYFRSTIIFNLTKIGCFMAAFYAGTSTWRFIMLIGNSRMDKVVRRTMYEYTRLFPKYAMYRVGAYI